jgi:hypothetical protein
MSFTQQQFTFLITLRETSSSAPEITFSFEAEYNIRSLIFDVEGQV